MKLEKNSEIFKSISYRYKFLVGARDPNMRKCFYKKRVVTVFWGSLSNPVDEEITSPIFRRRFLVPSHSQAT